MKKLIRKWREWRFKRGSHGKTFMIPRNIHDNIFYYPPEHEVSAMLDSTNAPRAALNWYKIGTGLRYGRLKPEFVQWMADNGPCEFKTILATNLSMSEYLIGASQNIYKRFQIRICHDESVALFKLTWL